VTAPDLSSHIGPRLYARRHGQPDVETMPPIWWAAMKKPRHCKRAELVAGIAAACSLSSSGALLRRSGDAARGKLAFTTKHCSVFGTHCRDLTPNGAPPVASGSPGRPRWCWPAGVEPRRPYARGVAAKKLARPQISAQELTDMLV